MFIIEYIIVDIVGTINFCEHIKITINTIKAINETTNGMYFSGNLFHGIYTSHFSLKYTVPIKLDIKKAGHLSILLFLQIIPWGLTLLILKNRTGKLF